MCFSSCNNETEPAELPYRYDVPVLIGTHISSYNLREIDFELDVAVFKGDNTYNEVLEFVAMPDSSFTFDDYKTSGTNPTWVRHTVEKVEYTDSVPLSTFSTVILIDQSSYPENFVQSDYYNQRYQAFNAFYKNLNGQGKTAFATYARTDGSHNVLKFLSDDLSDQWDEKTAKKLLDITHKQEGSAGLFDALEQTIHYLSEKNTENKSITLFVRNKDDGKSKLGLESIISLAKLNNIKINVIWLVKNTINVDIKALRQLPCSTGGFSVYMSYVYQSTTVFLSLSRLLKHETNFYRIKVKMTLGEPNWFNDKYSTGMFIYYYPARFFIWSYIPIYLEKP
jgi:hypothetical protein